MRMYLGNGGKKWVTISLNANGLQWDEGFGYDGDYNLCSSVAKEMGLTRIPLGKIIIPIDVTIKEVRCGRKDRT